MEENYINIAAILKEKPAELKLYSPTYGYIRFNGVHKGRVYFYSEDTNAHSVKQNGKMYDDGECIIFPSKSMRSWEKFAWKKGDVLDSDDGFRTCLFGGWKDNTYTEFFGKYHYCPAQCDEEDVWQYQIVCKTEDFYKSNAPESFMELLEKHEGGKLNLETLTIERDVARGLIGEFCYFEGKGLCVVSMLEKVNEDTFEFGDCVSWKDGEPDKKQYSINFYKPAKKEDVTVLRRATKQEYYEYMITKGRHTFKTFDKVLVRDDDNNEWEPAFFLRMNMDNKNYPYFCKILDIGFAESYKQCVPYKGYEHLAFTTDPF